MDRVGVGVEGRRRILYFSGSIRDQIEAMLLQSRYAYAPLGIILVCIQSN